MLFYDTIDSPTLDLLKTLQASRGLERMRLVGGTSLALQIGHRKSIDIDLFGQLEADPLQVSAILARCGSTTTISKSENIGVYLVNGIKVDIVNYPYPWLEDGLVRDGLLLAGKNDIAAMKLAAVTNRGTRKDLVDIYFLLQSFSLQQMLDLYLRKFADASPFMVLKSLTYFDDAELEPMPIMLGNVEWETVKAVITAEVEKLSR